MRASPDAPARLPVWVITKPGESQVADADIAAIDEGAEKIAQTSEFRTLTAEQQARSPLWAPVATRPARRSIRPSIATVSFSVISTAG